MWAPARVTCTATAPQELVMPLIWRSRPLALPMATQCLAGRTENLFEYELAYGHTLPKYAGHLAEIAYLQCDMALKGRVNGGSCGMNYDTESGIGAAALDPGAQVSGEFDPLPCLCEHEFQMLQPVALAADRDSLHQFTVEQEKLMHLGMTKVDGLD